MTRKPYEAPKVARVMRLEHTHADGDTHEHETIGEAAKCAAGRYLLHGDAGQVHLCTPLGRVTLDVQKLIREHLPKEGA